MWLVMEGHGGCDLVRQIGKRNCIWEFSVKRTTLILLELQPFYEIEANLGAIEFCGIVAVFLCFLLCNFLFSFLGFPIIQRLDLLA